MNEPRTGRCVGTGAGTQLAEPLTQGDVISPLRHPQQGHLEGHPSPGDGVGQRPARPPPCHPHGARREPRR